MNRRNLFKALLGLPFAGVLAPTVAPTKIETVTVVFDASELRSVVDASIKEFSLQILKGNLGDFMIRPEYRLIAENIADDRTRKWIDFPEGAPKEA